MATLRNISTPGNFPTYTYDVLFYSDTISTTVTSDPAVVTQWITEVKSIHSEPDKFHHVGFDTKCRLPYGPGPNQTATVQLCIGNRCLIYQIIYTLYKPRAFIEFFSDENYVFFGVGIDSAMQRLFFDYQILNREVQTLDLGPLAAHRCGIEALGIADLKSLARLVLGKEMDRIRPQFVTESAWNAWRLTPEQVQYACVDAFVSLQIGKVLANFDDPTI